MSIVDDLHRLQIEKLEAEKEVLKLRKELELLKKGR
jgi:hypothetical protein